MVWSGGVEMAGKDGVRGGRGGKMICWQERDNEVDEGADMPMGVSS